MIENTWLLICDTKFWVNRNFNVTQGISVFLTYYFIKREVSCYLKWYCGNWSYNRCDFRSNRDFNSTVCFYKTGKTEKKTSYYLGEGENTKVALERMIIRGRNSCIMILTMMKKNS